LLSHRLLLLWRFVNSIAMSANSKNANGSTGGGRKKGGGFLSRQAHTKAVTEEELLKKDHVTPVDVLRLTRATDSKLSLHLTKR